MNKKIYVIRRCATDYNLSNLISGGSDVPIVNKEIELVCDVRDKKEFQVYSSPLKRCIQTEQVLEEYLPITSIKLDERLKEREMGIFDGMDRAICKRNWPGMFNKQGKFIKDKTPPQGEKFDAFYNRVMDFWKSIQEELTKSNVIVISHNQTLKILYSIACKKNLVGDIKCPGESRERNIMSRKYK